MKNEIQVVNTQHTQEHIHKHARSHKEGIRRKDTDLDRVDRRTEAPSRATSPFSLLCQASIGSTGGGACDGNPPALQLSFTTAAIN